MPRRRASAVLAALLAAGCAAPRPPPVAAPAAPEEVRIGLLLPRSGPAAAHGAAVERGVRLALRAREQAGGAGRRVVLVPADLWGDPAAARQAALRLADEAHVQALLGDLQFRWTEAIAEVAAARRIPLLAPTDTDPRVTRDGAEVRPWVFRARPPALADGPVMARFARTALGLRRVALLLARDSQHATQLGAAFRDQWVRDGGEVVAEATYRVGDTDLTQPLLALQAAGPEAIYFPSTTLDHATWSPDAWRDVARAAQAARALLMGQPFLGDAGWHHARLLRESGDALQGACFPEVHAPDDPTPSYRAFAARYREVHGADPGPLEQLGHDAALLLLDAIDRAAQPDGPAIRDALGSAAVTGAAGPITMGADHDAAVPLLVLRVDGGQPRFAGKLLPWAGPPLTTPW